MIKTLRSKVDRVADVAVTGVPIVVFEHEHGYFLQAPNTTALPHFDLVHTDDQAQFQDSKRVGYFFDAMYFTATISGAPFGWFARIGGKWLSSHLDWEQSWRSSVRLSAVEAASRWAADVSFNEAFAHDMPSARQLAHADERADLWPLEDPEVVLTKELRRLARGEGPIPRRFTQRLEHLATQRAEVAELARTLAGAAQLRAGRLVVKDYACRLLDVLDGRVSST